MAINWVLMLKINLDHVPVFHNNTDYKLNMLMYKYFTDSDICEKDWCDW